MPLAPPSRKESCRAAASRLLRASIALQKLKLDGDEQFGVTIVRRACEEPVRQIVLNGGNRGRHRRREDQEPTGSQLRFQRFHRSVRRPGAGRRYRSHQGDSHGSAERSFHRLSHAHDRGDDLRDCGGVGEVVRPQQESEVPDETPHTETHHERTGVANHPGGRSAFPQGVHRSKNARLQIQCR